MNAVDQKQEK